MEAHLRDQVADGFGQAGIAVVRIAGADHGDDGEAADLAHDAVILAGGWRAELKDRPRGSADLPRGSVSRRSFLKSSALVGGSLVVGFFVPAPLRRLAFAQE